MSFVVNFVLWLLFATLYLGPSIVAVCRNHHRTPHIVAVNILLGWTIVGLFWAFAWALSATRATDGDAADGMPTDFAERLFRNRNVIRQPDGGAIVYPGLLADDAYWLGAPDFATYLQLRADERRRNFPRALVILIAGAGFFLTFRQWMGPEQGSAPAMLMFTAFTLFVCAWDLVLRPRRVFLAAFPKAPRTQDPIRRQRKILSGLVAFDPTVCFGATFLCLGLIASLSASLVFPGQMAPLRAQDGAMLVLAFAILGSGGVFYGHLAWHHVRFYMQHRRLACQADLEALGTGVKAPRSAAATSGNGHATRGLASTLRLGPGQG